jgi:hypothetical protein
MGQEARPLKFAKASELTIGDVFVWRAGPAMNNMDQVFHKEVRHIIEFEYDNGEAGVMICGPGKSPPNHTPTPTLPKEAGTKLPLNWTVLIVDHIDTIEDNDQWEVLG